ncbi:MAG: hypothetical protein GY946_33640, partial [bacterium]|nr:hypothetical protein [bacterium]
MPRIDISARLRRREFLIATAGFGAVACGGFPAPFPRVEPIVDDELSGLDALGQAEWIRRGDLTSRELVERAIARIEALDPPINAVVTRTFERALAQADGELPDGPFRGVPFLLKDLNDLAGVRTTMGSRLFADYVPTRSSPHTLKTLEGGLVIVGKTNTPEFGLVATTESDLLGPCRNPWNLAHSTGGSSGGAAAAVAAGMLPMAQASDGGGSIRVPASCCGVFGLKPSRGRNAKAAVKRALDISVKHVVSRTVRDSAAFLAVTERRDEDAPHSPTGYIAEPSSRRLRIAFHTVNAYGVEAHPDVKAAVESTAALCDGLGHPVEQASPNYRGPEFREHFLNLWFSGPEALVRSCLEQGLEPESVLEPVTLGMAARHRAMPSGSVEKAVAFFAEYEREMAAFFEVFDVVLSPVLRTPPIPLGT